MKVLLVRPIADRLLGVNADALAAAAEGQTG